MHKWFHKDKIEAYSCKAHFRELKAGVLSQIILNCWIPQSSQSLLNNLYSPTKGKTADNFEHITEYRIDI